MSNYYKYIKPFIIVGLIFAVFGFRFYWSLGKLNNCNQSCKKINTELDLINCLDNCAANADNKIPIYKIFTLGMVVILGFILATRYIDLIYLKKDKYYLKKIDDICSFFSDKKKIDNEYDLDYVKFQ